MKFELRQTFFLESARFLPHLPSSHPCSMMHGHSFKVSLIYWGTKDPLIGWVKDYHEVSENLKSLKTLLDHKVLNQISGLENPTSENLAYYIFESTKKWLPELVQVIVAETELTECRYPHIPAPV